MTFIAYKLGRVALGMLGKFAASLYFNAFYIWSAELNATVVRYVYVFFAQICFIQIQKKFRLGK